MVISTTITTDAEYNVAVEKANVLCDSLDDPWASPEFNALCDAIEKWEKVREAYLTLM